MKKLDYRDEFIKACREFGIGDMTIGHIKANTTGELTKEDWEDVYHAFLAFQYQMKLIHAAARARRNMKGNQCPK